MARCSAPLRSVLAATSFAPPRRRLVSTTAGSLVSPEDDLAWLLAAQVTRPVLFAQALAPPDALAGRGRGRRRSRSPRPRHRVSRPAPG